MKWSEGSFFLPGDHEWREGGGGGGGGDFPAMGQSRKRYANILPISSREVYTAQLLVALSRQNLVTA